MLMEHRNNVINSSRHLGIHCRDCGCFPFLKKTEVLARSHDLLTREIIETREIARADDECISTASISLSSKEIAFLDDD